MGELFLELTVSNVREPERHRQISFLVDTGATRAWVPQEVAETVGIQPMGMVVVELADGSLKEFSYGFCLFTYEGETIAGNVIIGPLGCEPLVGTHVLQDFRLVVDLERHQITRRRALRAKGMPKKQPWPEGLSSSGKKSTCQQGNHGFGDQV